MSTRQKGKVLLLGLTGLTLLAGLLLSGCAGMSASRTEMMQSWVGKHESELIKSWGPPQQEKSDGKGGRILVYSQITTYTQPGTSTTQVYSYGFIARPQYGARTTYTPAQTYSSERTRMFWVDENGYIYHWQWKGY